MNKAKLKSYAPQARKDFIAAVTARANLLGLSERAGRLEVTISQPHGDATVIAGQAWPIKVHSQRQQLITRIQKDGFAQTMEAVAYTWFNRFAALRYMELHDYLGHGHRALSSLEGGLPDILTYAAELAQSGDLVGLKAALVTEMKLAGNRDGELYRLLLVAQCNALSNTMPFLFEHIDDETELLLPDNLLRTDSVIAKLVASIDEEDWKDVEIIGWLYQFYISEKKEEVIGKVVRSEDIPAATQLFTPNWIVKYLVQNSVGRIWLMANPESSLRHNWPYYIEPSSQTPEVQSQLEALIRVRITEDGGSLNPESITLLDPACGSGHILVEAYDLLKTIYLDQGYLPRAIPRLILEKNLSGLDIDDRAAQLAGFALLMKARADDRRLFDSPVKLNVLSLQESSGLDVDELAQALHSFLEHAGAQTIGTAVVEGLNVNDLFPDSLRQGSLEESFTVNTGGGSMRATIGSLIATFLQAKTFGSLIQIPQALNFQLEELAEYLQQALVSGDLYAKAAAQDLMPLVSQARILGNRFDAVVENPPYMGSQFFNADVKKYLNKYHRTCEKDLFSAFISRSALFCKDSGIVGIVTSFTWMFISSFEELRKEILRERTLASLIQLEYDAFEDAKAHLCTFVFNVQHVANYEASFVRLSDFRGAENQGPKTLEAISNRSCGWFYNTRSDDFWKIPGNPISYWLDAAAFDSFEKLEKISDFGRARIGMATGKNDLYVRYWHEVAWNNLGLGLTRESAMESGKKWFPYAKGGGFRRWYGNVDVVVNWQNDGEVLRNTLHPSGKRLWAHNFNLNEIFKPAVCWNVIASTVNSFRYHDNGFLFDSAAGILQANSSDSNYALLGLLNSKISSYLLPALNPTINLPPGYLEQMPVILNYDFDSVVELIDISRKDWNYQETSWGFAKSPIIENAIPLAIEQDWGRWQGKTEVARATVTRLETENNRYFIQAYGLDAVLSADVLPNEVTLAIADREKDSQRLISYAIGCMMGRYSLDEPGLIYADAENVGFDASRYVKFPADFDGIVPLTDELWFEDEAASRIREFLLSVWGAETLTENMAWLAQSIGPKTGETPDETIRRYLAYKFYKDHLQTYKKRPIYWLFSSGKQGAFQALVYLHRYHEGTLARMRAEYVVPLTGKIQSRIDMLEKDAAAATSTATRNKLTKEVERLKKKHVELLAYDEQLRHHADMRVRLDLDHGVKVNYGKFGDLLAEVKTVTGGASDD
ncbi:BREX-1 system adenine-specific DNA-methyltransferase PglX [Duganella hordei]|uniref:BREX-1 system adenine-specific DNA-methyltransferase PglX n=1 Tax=Duganella hordei TaxID=2865934 RepID=UPI0030E7F4DD